MPARFLAALLAIACLWVSNASSQENRRPRATRTASSEENLSTFFVGRLKYSNTDGNDCGSTAEKLAQLVSSASTIPVQKERKLKITDPLIYETPFLFMNGHHDFVLTKPEIEVLRKYFANGGFLLASGCCTNPAFPAACRRELSRILPGEKIKKIEYDHPIYRSFYRITKIPVQGRSEEVYLEGLFFEGNLVAVLCEEGLCCSFAMDNSCNSGRGIAPELGRQIALNIAVYSLTH